MADGQQANFGQGSFGTPANTISLRSRKDNLGSSDRTLTGQSISAQQGDFGKTRTKALTGSAITASTGSVSTSSGAVSTALIVDEVPHEMDLINHDDIEWYGDFTSLATLMPGAQHPTRTNMTYPNRTGFWVDSKQWPTPYGLDPSIVVAPEFGLNAVRDGSQYGPSNCWNFVNAPNGSYGTCSIAQPGVTWVMRWLWPNNNQLGSPSAAGYTTSSIPEMWFRFTIMFESDVLTGMDEQGLKLPQLSANLSLNEFSYTMWMLKKISGQNYWHLKTYLGGSTEFAGDPANDNPYGDLEVWGSGPNNDLRVGQWLGGNTNGTTGNPVDKRILPDTWHDIELHVKMSSAAGVADGIREAWFDGQLLWSHQNCITHNTGASDIRLVRMQIYHGGNSSWPTQQIHVRNTGYAISHTRRIGRTKRLPSWRQNMAVWEYKEIPNTALSTFAATKPAWTASTPSPGVHGAEGPSGIYNDWCGAAIDTRSSTLWWILNGGHAGYGGNQAFKLRCNVDAPVFEEARGPTPGNQITYGTSSTERYGDGRPVSCHTYYTQHFIEDRNWVATVASHHPYSSGALWTDSNWNRQCEVFDTATGDYKTANTIPDRPTTPDMSFASPSFHEAVAKHPTTEDIYIWLNNDLVRWNQSSNTWTVLSKGGMANLNRHVMAIDDRRNRIFATAPLSGGPGAWIVDLTTFVDTPQTLTGTAANIAAVNGTDEQQLSMEFVKHRTDPTLDFFIVLNNRLTGCPVWTINAVTFAVSKPTLTGSPPGTHTSPSFNRVRYAPGLGCLLFPGTYTGNVRALRVADGLPA
jgi:hypothetical protein